LIRRVFCAAAGPADLIGAHRCWASGTHDPTEVSITFSGQTQAFISDIGAKGYLVSVHPDARRLEEGDFVLEHRPKRPRRGLCYHLEELRYCIGLLRTARRFRADVALLDSGITHYFGMALFPMFGIPVVPVLHNTLWASGFRPRGRVQRLIQRLDALFWKRAPLAALAVSPEAERQVRELSPGHHTPILQIRAQFDPGYFATIPPAPPHDRKPFQVMFIGRVHRIKGVLDIPLMARRVEDKQAGLVRWVICGRGPDLEEVQRIVAEQRVGHVVELRGWTSLEELREVYAASHASIVPTRSLFAEGLAMSAAEAILAGRPLISNPIVPALELLRPASMAARSNDPDSHADAVLELATNPELYEQLCSQCAALQAPFYDRSQGLRAVLHRALAPLLANGKH
jgi:glycosyltransferase involved in cell wall biosynthesis